MNTTVLVGGATSRARMEPAGGVEPHARRIAQRYDAEAVVLDLVEAGGAARRGFRWRRQAGFDEADRSAATL